MAPWRNLPSETGNGRAVQSRFRCRTLAGAWEFRFKALCKAPDFEFVLADATSSRYPQSNLGIVARKSV